MIDYKNNTSSHWEILALLKRGDFVRLWVANGLWWQAMWMEMLVTGWLALELTDSAWWVAVIGFCRSIPLLFIGPIGSIVTDRYLRRHLILTFQIVNALVFLLLAVLFGLGYLVYWHLGVFSLLQGCVWALDWPTRRAIIPDIVGRDKIVDAIVLENIVQNTTRIFGPLGAGLVVEALGIFSALCVLVAMAFISVAVLAGVGSQSRAPEAVVGISAAIDKTRRGWRFVRGHKRIWGVFLITVCMNVWAFPYMSLLPVFARDILGLGPTGLGWLGAAHGIGASLGLLLVNWGRRYLSNEWLFTFGSLFLCVGLIAFSVSYSYKWSLILMFCSGLGQAGFSIMQSSIILVEAPDEMRGQAMGALVLAIGMGPFGRLQSGAMADLWGAPFAVGSMAVCAGLATLAVAWWAKGFLGETIRRD
jgi:MFS family permease